MKEAGLLKAREEGRWFYYRLRSEPIGALQKWPATLAPQSERQAPSCE